MRKIFSRYDLFGFLAIVMMMTVSSCSVAGSNAEQPSSPSTAPQTSGVKEPDTDTVAPSYAIAIEPNSPADTVRAFYGHLREKRFRAAIYLTNLRPAVEGLSDSELKEFQVDFENVAKFVPPSIEINGEIIAGNEATVTVRLPAEEPQKTDIQELRLRKEKDLWTILSVDESAEARIKRDGKNYFRNLKIETHQDEAKAMLDRISKAQMAYAAQNGGKFTELRKLVEEKLVPDDVLSAESTGYSYVVTVIDGGAKYFTTATPAEYGKSGVMSFLVRLNERDAPLLSSKDLGGKEMTN